MVDNNIPHKQALENTKSISPLIAILEESKYNYIKENLSQHLHVREIKLLKQANSHSKPMHKKVRIEQYKQLKEADELNNIFELHKSIFIKKYRKLENKGLVEVDTECEELPYDITLTQKGVDLIEEIKKLDNEWNELMLDEVDGEKLLEALKKVSFKAASINHNHRKQQKFVF